ncbi:L-fucose:H+ symporter permease [Flagellimonas pelagia]|uniref:L-fucose:H+ symporter permease n=2 Tax=Flagellimonas pelagia TaxID=2306998 RepID=A0A3A1NDE9_9FLAO|nr:L-fucose:H+ symporter permease [Allomuricauda maritima]TXJ91529.1 L-fucose:H+ symporter permease [Allomuricauda maritima]
MPGNKWPFILITSLFFLWGLANNMTDTLLAAFKRIMSMTDFQTSWIQMAFYGSYFLLALPAAILVKKYTYKSGVLVGLGLFIIGALLFYPASISMVYGHFLVALFILAGGLSILETAANPYIISMGPEETATRRLNLAQSFNPIGSITGILLSKFFILSNLNLLDAGERAKMAPEELKDIQSGELTSVMGTYVGVAFFLLLIWILVKITKMPMVREKTKDLDIMGSIKRLLSNRNYCWSVTAQFFYMGAQIGLWSYTIRYVMQELGKSEDDASVYYLASIVLFSGSRFVFTALMKYITPRKLLFIAAALGSICTLVVIHGKGMLGVVALVLASGCMSLMFPTIYGLGMQKLGDDSKIGGSGLIMAILGGAVLTSVQGMVSDATGSIHLSFFVPLVCFLIVAIYSSLQRNLQQGLT